MHQQTYCHTLPKPFFKIFLFRIYAPTVQTRPHHIDPIFAETSVPVSTNTHAHTASTNQSTNDTVQHTPQIPHPYTHHEFRAHTAPQTHTPIQSHKRTRPHSHHKRTQPPQTHNSHKPTPTPTRRQAPTTLSTHREAMPYLDVDAQPASSGLTVRPSGRTRRRSPDAVAEFAIGQTRHQAGCALNHTPDQATHSQSDRPSTRQAKYRIRPNQTRPNRIRPSQSRPLAQFSTGPAGRSPQIFPPNLTAD